MSIHVLSSIEQLTMTDVGATGCGYGLYFTGTSNVATHSITRYTGVGQTTKAIYMSMSPCMLCRYSLLCLASAVLNMTSVTITQNNAISNMFIDLDAWKGHINFNAMTLNFNQAMSSYGSMWVLCSFCYLQWQWPTQWVSLLRMSWLTTPQVPNQLRYSISWTLMDLFICVTLHTQDLLIWPVTWLAQHVRYPCDDVYV